MKNLTSKGIVYNEKKLHNQAGKTITIRRTAVQEIDMSLYHGNPLEGPPESHQAS